MSTIKVSMLSFWRSKRTLLIGMLVSALVAAYFLAPVPGGITGFQIAGSGGTAMAGKLENGTAQRSVAIPPIDASLPGVTETATFALG